MELTLRLCQECLKCGGASFELRKALAKFVMCLSNSYPPWAAYRALTWGRLIGLGKNPGVRPLGIGGMLRRLKCKVLLLVTGAEASRSCGSDQLCGGLESGIEGGIHFMRSLWEMNSEEDN